MTEPQPPSQPEETGERRILVPSWLSLLLPRSPALVFRSLLRLIVFLFLTYILWWLAARLMSPFLDVIVNSQLSLGLVAFLTTAMMMRLYEMRPVYMIGFFANRAGAMHLALGLTLGAGSSLAIVGIQWACGWTLLESSATDTGWLSSVALGFVVLLIGAAGEELLFRGYAFQHLICAIGPWASIISTSALFALAHRANPAYSPVGMVNTGLFGMVFGYAYWRTRDLWLPLGMHFAWNFSLAVVGAYVSGLKIKIAGLTAIPVGAPLWSGGDYGPEASLLATFVLMGIAVGLWRAPLERQEQGITCD